MEDGVGRRVSRGMLPLLALHTLSEYYRSDRRPPVTAALIAANTLIYLRPGVLDPVLPTIDQVWFNPNLIIRNKDLKRFFLSAFYHVGEPHLVYNMLSLLWKGIQLENSMGSAEFASMVAVLVAMSQGITLLLSKSLLLFFDYERAYYSEFAVGFSGVLFAMKVILNSQSGDYSYVNGLLVPTRYAAWAELVLVQLLVPGVSFLGHLGGILAGVLYLRLRGRHSGPDPLALIIRKCFSVLCWPVWKLWNILPSRRRRFSGRGTTRVNHNGRITESVAWRCASCTFDNSGYLNVCEMCGTGRYNGVGLSSQRWSHDSGDLSLEELRQRRLERFGN